jgi:hypothetical protein
LGYSGLRSVSGSVADVVTAPPKLRLGSGVGSYGNVLGMLQRNFSTSLSKLAGG